MCIEINAEDFATVHHELGHNFYQRAYNRQPVLFRDSANDGFHEAIGDTIALSITPEYLVKVGLLDQAPPRGQGRRLPAQHGARQGRVPAVRPPRRPVALEGLLGRGHSRGSYNQAWWDLRRKYQGVAPPVARTEADFDPGAKYHVAGQRPLHALLPRATSCSSSSTARSAEDGRLHDADSTAARSTGTRRPGEKLIRMLEMGQSKPWPDALEALTGQRQMDATAILDYFAPLQKWLDEQNKGKVCGW